MQRPILKDDIWNESVSFQKTHDHSIFFSFQNTVKNTDRNNVVKDDQIIVSYLR